MALTQISTDGIKNGTITGSDLATNVDLVDNQKLRLGTGNDLEIYHNSGFSYIDAKGDQLRIEADQIRVRTDSGESYIETDANSAVKLYFDNTERFKTLSTGVLITGTDDGDGGAKGDFKFMQTDGTLKAMFDASASAFEFYDNTKAIFGNGDDLQIYHASNISTIKDNYGDLRIQSNTLRLQPLVGNENFLYAIEGGTTRLFYDGATKFETTASGIAVTGAVEPTGHIKLGDDRFVYFGAGVTTDLYIGHQPGDSRHLFRSGDGATKMVFQGGSETMMVLQPQGQVELYFDNSKKFFTITNGVQANNRIIVGENNAQRGIISGDANGVSVGTIGDLTFNLIRNSQIKARIDGNDFQIPNDNGKIELGASQDLQIYHNGTASFIKNTTGGLNLEDTGGYFRVKSDDIKLEAANGEDFLECDANGAVSLYYDASKKFETTNTGVQITSNGSQNGLILVHSNGNTSAVLRHVGTGDEGEFHLKDSGSTLLYLSGASGGDSNITTGGNFDLEHDSAKLRLGASNDLQIFHDGAESYVKNANSNSNLILESNHGVDIKHGGENMAKFKPDAAVELYYDNSKKFETNSSGVKVLGQLIQERSSARAIALNRLGSAGQMVLFDFQGTKCGEILVDTNSTSYITNGSDKSLKKNFQSWSENVLNLFKNINPQEFHFNNQQDTDKKHKGYIAQDMVDSFPEAYPKDDEGKYAFNPSGMVVYLMKAIQELEAEVAALKAA